MFSTQYQNLLSTDVFDDEIMDGARDVFKLEILKFLKLMIHFPNFHTHPLESNFLDEITYGDDQELNKQIKEVCSEFSDIFSSSLPMIPASLKPFIIDIDRSKWEGPSNRTQQGYSLP